MEYRFADCVLDHARRTLTRGGDPVSLEPQVFDLIALLVSNPDRVIPRDELVDVVWGGRIVSDSAISARIASARKAVGDDGKRQEVIRTVARVGLQMATPVEDQGADGPMNEVYETAEVIFNAFDVEPHQAARDAINSVSNVDLLGQIRIPTLIVHGRHDAIHPLSEAQKLATGIANAELVVLDTANHLPFPGHPTWPKFASVVRNFLDK